MGRQEWQRVLCMVNLIEYMPAGVESQGTQHQLVDERRNDSEMLCMVFLPNVQLRPTTV